ncbi:apoptosis-stimulating of p53 protein 2-like isoform X2 [Tigriopus californicus]|uniref:apoptosis-stimulating of p53 protein 2-like isoform X2 n=1 Tax=Tigriopus californicus TaxID=6832 RepID=UPI0027DA07E1|nr:apoptosis-stimulating of p53 protein 2-like isoform X2 [Tigriopus californicus]
MMSGCAQRACISVHCNVESRVACREKGSDHLCFVISNTGNRRPYSSFYGPSASSSSSPPPSHSSGHQRPRSPYFDPPSSSSTSGFFSASTSEDDAMREPGSSSAPAGPQHQSNPHPTRAGGGGGGSSGSGGLSNLSPQQLQEMAQRQQRQIDSQQQLLVAKEQRLKYLRQQDYKQQQMAAEYERLRRLREKVEAQELKLRKLRALRGQANHGSSNGGPPANAAVLADLESIRSLFGEKEKELTVAVRKVDELTHQLEDLRSGRVNNIYPPQVMELERLRRELAYRKQLNEQQNNMISQQRAQLSMGQEEMIKIDNRILELQDRLARKRMMNQQLANQINAATTAKQAQLRAIQQGMNKNKNNKPVSTVEPFQRQMSSEQHLQDDLQNKLNKNEPSDPKYQTLPFGTKFGGPMPPPGAYSKNQKIEQLKMEKENNNVQFADNLPTPPPPLSSSTSSGMAFNRHSSGASSGNGHAMDSQGNYNQTLASNANDPRAIDSITKPISSVAPVFSVSTSGATPGTQSLSRPTDLFPPTPDNYNLAPKSQSTPIDLRESPDSSNKPKPALPPKPLVSKGNNNGAQPPPYVPAPPPDGSRKSEMTNEDETAITIRGNQVYETTSNLSVSAHPEEGTSVDDDSPTQSDDTESHRLNGGGMQVNNHNVHISINRRIEMPPAFHFPEDQTPPSDLIANDFSRDMADNAGMYPMMNQIYKEFDHLSIEERNQLLARSLEEEEYLVPEIESDHEPVTKPPGILRKKDKPPSRGRRNICFDALALLLDASLEGEFDLVQATAQKITNLSAANDEGITALHNAICAGHFDVVKFLVEFGCDVNAQDADGWTPLHCAASCNNLPMIQFLVEHGACIFATTFSDQETAAEKCEEDEEGYLGCSEYLLDIQEQLGTMNNGEVFAVYDYQKVNADELCLAQGDKLVVLRRGDEVEEDWWWSTLKKQGDQSTGPEGYVAKNLLGLYPRVKPLHSGNSNNGNPPPQSGQMSESSDSDKQDEDKDKVPSSTSSGSASS